MPNFITRPLTDKPRKLADLIADEMDNIKGNKQGDRGLIKPFMAGAIQGVGDLASDMTSPLGIATLALPYLRGARGLGAIGKLATGAEELAPTIGRRLSNAEKMFDVVDDAGRVLTNPGGYAGPVVEGKAMTQGAAEAVEKLKQLKTAVTTKIKPPRDITKRGVDY